MSTDDYAALAALAEERRKFQAETLTTSFLAGLLRDGWTRCHRCGIRDGERVYVLGNLREWVCSPCLATPPKLTRERDEARAAIDRVRALHADSVRWTGEPRYCAACSQVYPCATIRALATPDGPADGRHSE